MRRTDLTKDKTMLGYKAALQWLIDNDDFNSFGYDPTGPEAGAGFRDYSPDTPDD